MKQSILYKNQYSISYAEYGDKNGFPILIHHGLIASIQEYELFERLLQRGAHLLCIARPGYGESSPYIMENLLEWADIVSVLIEELGFSRFDILGMSSGAPYSYAVGYMFPEKARNIYIFSGIPALYDDEVQSHWPFPVNKNAGIAELQSLAYELFFSNVSNEDLDKNDVKDSMMNSCFGVAQDLKLRVRDWGFRLSDVSPNVYMQHSQYDQNVPLITAQLTAKMLPSCELKTVENGEHFSAEALDEFIRTVILEKLEGEKRILHP